MSAQKDFIAKMLGELEFAEKKHDSYPTDRIHAAAILNEEAGKLTRICNDYEAGRIEDKVQALDLMEEYSARVGAMALCFYTSLPARDGE